MIKPIFKQKLSKEQMKETLLSLNDEEWVEEYNQDNMRCESYNHKTFFEKYNETIKKKGAYSYRWVAKKISKKETVLDVGSGPGYMAKYLVDKGIRKYIGVDVSDKVVEFAKVNVPEVKFIQGFAEKLDVIFNMHEKFDVVLCQQLIEHVKKPEKVIEQLFKVCKKGGKVFVATPIGKRLNDIMHINHFGYYQMEYLFKPYTDNFKIYKLNKRFDTRTKYVKEQELKLKTKVTEDIFIVEAVNDGSKAKG